MLRAAVRTVRSAGAVTLAASVRLHAGRPALRALATSAPAPPAAAPKGKEGSGATAHATRGVRLVRFSARRSFSFLHSRLVPQPVSWASFLVTLATGAGLVYYFREERKKIEARGPVSETKSIGVAKLGGPFELVDHDGRTVTEKDYLGRFIMVYFGFTHCPDACPEELGKMAEVTDKIKADKRIKHTLTPVFISVDPKRDSVQAIRDYVREFSPDMVGLTGSVEQVEKAARAYRVYFAPIKTADGEDDYLVDHSIFFYLMDPEGKFVDCYGHTNTVTFAICKRVVLFIHFFVSESLGSITRHMINWKPAASKENN